MRFQDTLNDTVSDFQRPANLPQGNYILQVTGPHTQRVGGADDRWETLSFPCRPVEPTDDVDTDSLAEYGDITKTLLTKDFILDTTGSERDMDAVKFQVKTFLTNCGVDLEGKTLKQALAEVVGARFLATISWQQNKNDPEQYFVRVGRTAPVE